MAERPTKDERPAKDISGGEDTSAWRRVGEFLRNILEIERSIRGLRSENAELRARVDELQRMVDEHHGQLKLLSDFVKTSLDDRVERRAEDAAMRTLERFMAFAGRIEGRDRTSK
jgi:hypothetical protein